MWPTHKSQDRVALRRRTGRRAIYPPSGLSRGVDKKEMINYCHECGNEVVFTANMYVIDLITGETKPVYICEKCQKKTYQAG